MDNLRLFTEFSYILRIDFREIVFRGLQDVECSFTEGLPAELFGKERDKNLRLLLRVGQASPTQLNLQVSNVRTRQFD